MQNRGPKPGRDGTVPATHLSGYSPPQALVQILAGLIDLYLTALAGTYLTFQAGGETCGLRVPQVVSVARFPNIRPLPGAPEYVRGTVSENGAKIPVIDLRLKMQMRFPASPAQDQKHLVFACVNRLDGELQLVGVVVDRVDVLVKYASEEITPGFQPPMSI